jgi:hypothetical protein
MMGFGLELILHRPFAYGHIGSIRTMTLSMLLYACVARVVTPANECSYLGYAAYVFCILITSRSRRDQGQDQDQDQDQGTTNERVSALCQELLNVIHIGLVLLNEDGIVMTNNMAFELLRLPRGDLGTLQKICVEQAAALSAKPKSWIRLDSAFLSKPSSALQPKSLLDDSGQLECMSNLLFILLRLDGRWDWDEGVGGADLGSRYGRTGKKDEGTVEAACVDLLLARIEDLPER